MSLFNFLNTEEISIPSEKVAGKVMDSFLANEYPEIYEDEPKQEKDLEDTKIEDTPLNTDPLYKNTYQVGDLFEIQKDNSSTYQIGDQYSINNHDQELNTFPSLTAPMGDVSEFLKNYKPEQLSNVEGVIPEDLYKDLPTLEQAIRNEIPENYEVILQKFYPYIMDYNIHSSGKDISFDALWYLGLGGLGGKTVTWQLGREFRSDAVKKHLDMEKCKCDANHGNTFEISGMLNYAVGHSSEKGYDPPAPMFSLANHPGCRCSVVFSKAANFTDYTSISNDCYGLPTNVPQEIIDKDKKVIFNALPETVFVNAATMPPLYISEKKASLHHTNTRFGSIKLSSSSESINKPIEVRKDNIAILPMGFWNPINEGWLGFALEEDDKYVTAFLVDLMNTVKIRKDVVRYIDTLSESSEELSKDTGFILSEHTLGIFCYQRHNGKNYAYFPEDRAIKEIGEDFTILTF